MVEVRTVVSIHLLPRLRTSSIQNSYFTVVEVRTVVSIHLLPRLRTSSIRNSYSLLFNSSLNLSSTFTEKRSFDPVSFSCCKLANSIFLREIQFSRDISGNRFNFSEARIIKPGKAPRRSTLEKAKSFEHAQQQTLRQTINLTKTIIKSDNQSRVRQPLLSYSFIFVTAVSTFQCDFLYLENNNYQ